MAPQPEEVLTVANWFAKWSDIIAIKELWRTLANAYSADNPEYWFAQAKIHEQDEQWELAAKAYLQVLAYPPLPASFGFKRGKPGEYSEWSGRHKYSSRQWRFSLLQCRPS